MSSLMASEMLPRHINAILKRGKRGLLVALEDAHSERFFYTATYDTAYK